MTAKKIGVHCTHCGDDCGGAPIKDGEANFCCSGCQSVYAILSAGDLCDFYANGDAPGASMKNEVYYDKFSILDDKNIRGQFVLYEDDKLIKVKFVLPQIHCTACIWLLENLGRLDEGIQSSSVNFNKQEVTIQIYKDQISVREMAILLTKIGYEPRLLVDEEKGAKKASDRLLLKIGIAGFCFGNIMLSVFPEYLGLGSNSYRSFFAYSSLILSIPVVFYSGWDYLLSAFKSYQQKHVNLDIPIAIGIVTLFLRSVYEILTQAGGGYLDSLSGFIFFLLIGKWFQQKTYKTLSFERNYKSYFPLSVNRLSPDGVETVKLDELRIGDEILIRNNELVPADAILMVGESFMDYSFVTGESDKKHKYEGDKVFAGGKHYGTQIKIKLTHKPDNSYLTQLWNQDSFKKSKDNYSTTKVADGFSKYFTYIILIITAFTAVYWFFADYEVMWNATTAVLIVACPCALALSIPFTMGNAIRHLARENIFIKNTAVIEKLSNLSHIVMDKTGTLTQANKASIRFVGESISELHLRMISSLLGHSSHPLSISLVEFLNERESLIVDEFEELEGLGLRGVVGGKAIKVGSSKFIGVPINATRTIVGVNIDDVYIGYFEFDPQLRKGIKECVQRMRIDGLEMSLISGDNNSSDVYIEEHLAIENRVYDCSPMDKLKFVEGLQKDGQQVAMIGDGLNDSGALQQSDVGIAVSDDVNYFVPACDVIMDGGQVENLASLISYSRKCLRIIYVSFGFSVFYNLVGLSFAITGSLSPVIAAILMPVSSISIVIFTTIASKFYFDKIFK